MSTRDRGPDHDAEGEYDDPYGPSRDHERARAIPQQPTRGSDQGRDDDAFVIDTRGRRRPGGTGRPARGNDVRKALRRQPAGTLYPEDDGYTADDGYGAPADGRSHRPVPAGQTAGRAARVDRPDASRTGAAPSSGRLPGPRQPSPRPPGARPPGEAPPAPSGPSRRRRRARAVALLVVLLLVAWVGFMVWVPFAAWGRVTRTDDAPSGERPADTPGYNYLLVGSDGRGGLSAAQKSSLNAGGPVEGQRTDSIILVHVPEGGGKSALISIPRDSYVPIPGYSSNKINAAYAFGGPQLLEATIEQVTGVHIDGYVEIGFGGFAGVVDSLGGVDVCVPFAMKDKDAAINLKKGCQTLDGATALGYVRARKSDPRGDIGRAERQRQFLGAIMKKAVTPSTVLIPWRYKGFADSAASGLVVGKETQLTDAVRVLQTLRGVDGGDTLSLVVPVADPGYQTRNAGVAVKWDTKAALALFTMIKNDEPLTVPPEGTTGS